MRFIAWAMLASTVFVVLQFVATRDPAPLARPAVDLRAVARDGRLSTVLPTWLIAEAIRRIGANTSSLVGSLGPGVHDRRSASLILGEPCMRSSSPAPRSCSSA